MRFPLAFAVVLCACSATEGPLMAPGQDCLGCHDGAQARRWTVAGTWVRGAKVALTDASGKTVPLRGNKVGNFYTAEPLAFPVAVSVEGRPMPNPVTYGGCNLCHANGQVIALELMAPGQDCFACHDGTRAKRWTVAGTWPPQGSTVTLRGHGGTGSPVTLTTNQVGNFFTEQALVFPLVVSVNGSQMPDPVTYGGCNACHGAGGDAGGN